MGATYKGHRLKLAKHPCRAQVSENGQLVTCLDMFRIVKLKGAYRNGKRAQRIVTCAMHNHRVQGKQAEVWR